ncbi:MAG TPA: VWA domain-containing protein [Pyrinomonadaceae bacterium]|nr:VWA domain-containing protein [Pyrinomonadaceae bacterium]
MRPAARTVLLLALTIIFISTAFAGDTVRELKVAAGGAVEIVNLSGRVLAKAEAAKNGVETAAKLVINSPKTVAESEVRVSTAAGRTIITVAAKDPKQRIDLALTLPERTSLKIETEAGGIEAMGNFARVEARTDTGTVAVDVPTDALQYHFQWTESRPRYLADFDIEKVKEKSGGRFEIKGRYSDEGGKRKAETGAVASVPRGENDPAASNTKVTPRDVTLDLTTARGIILLNVSPNEVMSDLRERPLSNAAKAIVRSGDSLLMEAIRRASPKYFGDYARTLPPLNTEPKFSPTKGRVDVPNAPIKTAIVRVTDLKNRAIGGLSAADFDVVENGASREIVDVQRSTAPFNLVLLLDVSGSVENYVNFIRRAARNFVETVDSRDRVSIVIFNDDTKMLSAFTTDKNKLSKSLDTFDAGGGTAYYDALAFVISDTLRSLHGERSAIVVLTDGDDNRSFLAFDSLTGSIQESGALIYPLYVPSALIAASVDNPNADIDPVRRKYMSLSAKAEGEGEKLARISGGVYYPISAVSQIQQAYEDIVSQLRTAYAITYRSDITDTDVTPRLKIRSKRENTFTTVTSVVAAQ